MIHKAAAPALQLVDQRIINDVYFAKTPQLPPHFIISYLQLSRQLLSRFSRSVEAGQTVNSMRPLAQLP